MKKLTWGLLVLLSALALAGCKTDAFPDNQSGNPVFFFRGTVDGDSLALDAGVNGQYLFSGTRGEGEPVQELWGRMSSASCDDCAGSLEIAFRATAGINPASFLAPGLISFLQNGAPDKRLYRVAFTADSTAGEGFQWSLGDGEERQGGQIEHVYYDSIASTYLVCLETIGADGCSSTICNQLVLTEGSCKADFSYSPYQSGSNFIFFRNKSTATQPVRYRWSFGDGSRAGLGNPAYAYQEPGKYLVCLRITDGSGCESIWCKEIAVDSTICTSGFSYQVTTETIGDTLQNGRVMIRYRDAKGDLWSSAKLAQAADAQFEILSVEPYENNRAGKPTLLVRFRATAVLGRENKTRSFSGEGTWVIETR